jgi:hypothetical protein
MGRDHRAAALYPAGPVAEPDHDAAMRIGGEAPSGGPILYRGDEAIVRHGTSPPRIVSAARCGCAAEVRAVQLCYAPARQGVGRRATPAGTSPEVTSLHKAMSSFLASATIMVLRVPPRVSAVRARYHCAKTLSF